MTLLMRVEWKDAATNTEIIDLSPLSDVISLTARKGLDIKNNILNFTVKNANSKYVDETGTTQLNEDDLFDVYLKETSDASDIGSTWYDSTNFLGSYYLKEFKQSTTSGAHRITVQAIDKAYVLFNKVYANTYGFAANDYWTAPGIFRSTVRINSPIDSTTLGYLGTDNDEGVRFDIDAKFLSEGGNITDYRADTSTTLNGALGSADTTIDVASTTGFESEGTIVINGEHIYYSGVTATSFTGCVRGIDDTKAEAQSDTDTVYQGFPVLLFSKAWKPIYEWLSELGQPVNTNYSSEQVSGGTLNYDRSFLLWVDKDNKIYYVPTTDDVDTDLEIGTDDIFECVLDKAVFDSVNMVIYNVGTDMNGAGLTWYWYDENTDTNDLKMRYQPMIDVIPQLLLDWKNYADNNGISIETTPANDTLRRYPADGEYPISDWSFKAAANSWRSKVGKTAWSTLANDGDFNESLRDAALWVGLSKAQNLTARVGGLRYRGTVTTKGAYYNPGDLIRVTDSKTGISQQKVRVIDVSQIVSKGQWSTNLSVEEDEEAIRN